METEEINHMQKAFQTRLQKHKNSKKRDEQLTNILGCKVLKRLNYLTLPWYKRIWETLKKVRT